MSTVGHTRIHSWWDGRVLIDELKEYKDSRGMLCELWRTDDDTLPNSSMSYWSETDPYVLRGPHEHVDQRDAFVTWRSRMLYILYDQQTKESKTFITDPTKITRVIVDPTVVHCYRNLEPNKSLTGNFPTSLFMGKDKTEKIDEIRHEEHLKEKKMYVILGANGRLGKSMTKTFLDNIGFYEYEVVPIYHRISNSVDITTMIDNIEKVKALTSATDVTIINCIGSTDVQNSTSKNSNLFWANSDLPFLLGEYSGRRGFNLIHFSSDYVYQEVKPNITEKVSPYTESKKLYEEMLKEAITNGSKKHDHVRVLRVANLFSSDTTDENNIFQKLNKSVKKFNEIKYDSKILTGATHVDVISEWVFENRDTISKNKMFTNLVSPDVYNIREILIKYFNDYAKRIETSSIFVPWFNAFKHSDNVIELKSSDKYIVDLITNIT